jgi:hypothetical protein
MILRTLPATPCRCRPMEMRTYVRDRADGAAPEMWALRRVQAHVGLFLAPESARSARQLLPHVQGRLQTTALSYASRALRCERGAPKTRAHRAARHVSHGVLPRATVR